MEASSAIPELTPTPGRNGTKRRLRLKLVCGLAGARPAGRENYAPIMSEYVDKQNIIEDNRAHEKDTGSGEVQIALLTARIAHLTEHLKTHR